MQGIIHIKKLFSVTDRFNTEHRKYWWEKDLCALCHCGFFALTTGIAVVFYEEEEK